jgi:hypothetical protein
MLEPLFDAELVYRSDMEPLAEEGEGELIGSGDAEGAHVHIEARGFARRSGEASRRWAVAATLRFESEDERYRWLADALGVWEGEFDAEAHRAHYQAYVVSDGASGARR